MFKKSNAGDQLLIAVKLNKISEISRLVALGVDVNSRIDKVTRFFGFFFGILKYEVIKVGVWMGCIHEGSYCNLMVSHSIGKPLMFSPFIRTAQRAGCIS